MQFGNTKKRTYVCVFVSHTHVILLFNYVIFFVWLVGDFVMMFCLVLTRFFCLFVCLFTIWAVYTDGLVVLNPCPASLINLESTTFLKPIYTNAERDHRNICI